VPLPFLRSIGLGGLLIPLASVATALSLLPVLLASAGRRLSWPRRRAVDPRSRVWGAIAGAVVRRPVPFAIGATLLLLAMAAPVLSLRLGTPQLSAYAPTEPAGAAVRTLLDAGLPAGLLRPTEVVVPAADAGAARDTLAAVDGVAAAAAPTGPGWAADGTRLVQVWAADDPATDAGRATLDRVRALGLDVGGNPAEDADFVTAVYGDAPLVVGGVVVATFLLLARALRSFWLPVKALLLNVVSIAAAYGLTVLIWQQGYGADLLFGTDATGALTIWVPVAVFAFLFGLSMDYEVFILSRMREEYDRHGDTRRAVVDGIAYTGRLVTSAALILFLAFVALSTVPTVEVKVLATALALGIAIDAVIVRGLLAPALVVLLGRWNWWLPRPLARLLRV
jgi:RND superfamily putative drug exporter